MKKIIILLILLTVFSGLYLMNKRNRIKPADINKMDIVVKKNKRIGEKIVYLVKLGEIILGKAVFERLPDAELNGKLVSLMTFETKLARFKDLEKIYSHPDSFLPLRVERLVSTWPIAERITEDYNQQTFTLSIKKLKGKREETISIKKQDVINNVILLPYYVRDMADLDIGYKLKVRLPTQDFDLKLVEKEEIKVPAGRFMAYRFESEPRKIEIWISANQYKIPLKIKGTNGLGYTLVMQEHKVGLQ